MATNRYFERTLSLTWSCILILWMWACVAEDPVTEDANNILDDVLATQVWPLSGNQTVDRISDPYGPRLLNGVYDFHRGIDFRAAKGTPVHPVIAGTVVRADDTQAGDVLERLGKFVVVAHAPNSDGDEHQTAYYHLDRIDVGVGAVVTPLSILGLTGNSGIGINSEHLHMTYFVGVSDGSIHRQFSRNPMRLLPFQTDASVALHLSKTANELTAVVTQESPAIIWMRLEFMPEGQAVKQIDFETRSGINSQNEDENPYGDVTISPQAFSAAASSYVVTYHYHGDWVMTENFDFRITDITGMTQQKSYATQADLSLNYMLR